ncbi:DivIVA domain-containing protein [Anaerotruncus sp. 80]|uniref:DivIVA domain-containing protein n=1 Tax=Anaerotruncus colihominis TaxID=169435 RepID=A0A845QLL3_9FIRM|nr:MULTISPECIES: DivIVA domain-containing protein [Anaerotruncus]NBH60968.1 DivIVA domain-containing protein [Anaerotruncus colihominis]NCF01623.1 DivIVA domain-containing protein [Anaerotruncus sp. 80]
MITPQEIETKEFSKSMRGYNAEEVDEFLDMIILDLQQLMDENARQQKTIKSLEADLSQYKRSETSVLNTLESAKKLMNDISESAEKRAEIIIRNAQLDAETIQREARDSVSKLTEEGEKLKYRLSTFRERYRKLLEDQLSQIEGSSEELFAELEREFMPASMEETIAPKAPARPAQSPMQSNPEPAMPPLQKTQVRSKMDSRDTMVIGGEKSLEEMLMEDLQSRRNEETTQVNSDMFKTRVIK